jgi:hypothetical protein
VTVQIIVDGKNHPFYLEEIQFRASTRSGLQDLTSLVDALAASRQKSFTVEFPKYNVVETFSLRDARRSLGRARIRSSWDAIARAHFSAKRLPICRLQFVFLFFRIHAIDSHPASMTRGVRVVTNVEAGCDGRVDAVRRTASMRTVKSCGPGLPVLRPSVQCFDEPCA